MTIEEQLKDLMIKKSGSVNKFAHDCGLSTSTVATIFVRGIDKTNINTVIKICKALSISTDELANGRITRLIDYSPNIERVDLQMLNERNRELILAYYQALLDSQEN